MRDVPTCRSSVSIEAPPDVVFDLLSDPRRIPEYVTWIQAVEPLGFSTVRATFNDTTQDADFEIEDGHRKRVDWSIGGWKAWFEVDKEGVVCSVTAEVEAVDIDDPALDRMLYTLKATAEGA
jgi:hypothetical protein